jgi:ribonuclease D
VAHNAKFDEGSLKSVGFAPEGLLDTLRLARKAVPLKSFSLASVAGYLFGRELDKTYQRSDWRIRPLSRAQLSYAALDAQVVLEVYDGLAERLVTSGRWEKERERARLDFKQKREPRQKKEKKSLIDRPWTAEERKLLDQLLRWRAQAALLAGLPGHFICSERTLEHLVLIRPHTPEDLSTIFGLGPVRIARFGVELLAQLDSSR